MQIGAELEALITLYCVEIEGRGGDSAHDEYFLDSADAIIASAVDGQNREPHEVPVWKFSDGTYVLPGRTIGISKPANKEQKKQLLEKLTPAQKLLLGRQLRSL